MNNIITISREFGSGGKELGKRLADELGYAYYDSEIISMLAKDTKKAKEYIENIATKGEYPYTFEFAKSFESYPVMQSSQTEMLISQAKVLKEVAAKGNAVIVGRAASAILSEYNPMNIFVYADMKSKIKRCKEKATDAEKLTDKQIEKNIREIDKRRKACFSILSGKGWGDKTNYTLCINTSNIEVKALIPALKSYAESWFLNK